MIVIQPVYLLQIKKLKRKLSKTMLPDLPLFRKGNEGDATSGLFVKGKKETRKCSKFETNGTNWLHINYNKR